MSEYRKEIPLGNEGDYFFVAMGPIPDKPEWHQEMYAKQSYPFPTLEAATRFAQTHKAIDPGRHIEIRYPDGRRWDGVQWVT